MIISLGVSHPKSIIADAISYLHGKNILHRDLKPENILAKSCQGGEIKLKICDFGVAKLLNQKVGNMYYTRDWAGTPVYMAPEVVDKQAYGRSADFWSLGVVVYDMLVGHTPFHVEKTSRRGHHGGRRATVHGALPLGGHHSLRPKTDRNATRYNILHCNYRCVVTFNRKCR